MKAARKQVCSLCARSLSEPSIITHINAPDGFFAADLLIEGREIDWLEPIDSNAWTPRFKLWRVKLD